MRHAFRRLRLRTKVLLAPLIILILLFVMIAMTMHSIRTTEERERWVMHTQEVIGAIDHLLLQLVNAETGYRGFLITGDASFLEPYTHGMTVYQQDQARLQQLVSDNPAQIARLQEIHNTVQGWLRTIVGPGVALRQQVTEGTAPQSELNDFVRTYSGKQTFDQLRREIAQFRRTETDLLAARHREATAAAQQLQRILIVGTGLALIIGLLVSVMIARSLGGRVAQVVDATVAFTEGRLQEHTSLPEGPDEIGRMATAFKTMASRLQEQFQALQNERQQAETARAAAEQAHATATQHLTTIQDQQAIIRGLSVPVLPLNRKTLVMPLIGVLDSARLGLARQQALQAVEQYGARYLLLDVTGVPVIDTSVAGALVGVVQASRLLGAHVLLIGIRPDVAQSIVGLGIQLADIATYPTLKEALDHVTRTEARLTSNGTHKR